MTDLNKRIKRVSKGLVQEAGKRRPIIIILRPPNVLGFRAKGCRREYQLTAEACWTMAIKADVAAAKRAKKQSKLVNRK